ncbi:MAG: hypothetical protein IKO19_04315 [Candidatus Riflebacteria bacterium]|nr:hypothetical protein [Candidatus Riflebacteria bacterium]
MKSSLLIDELWETDGVGVSLDKPSLIALIELFNSCVLSLILMFDI